MVFEHLMSMFLAFCFVDVIDVVYIDEKWFYLQEVKKNYYLGNDEPDPYRSTSNKRFIPKVMFLTKFSRNSWDTSQNRHFDGNIDNCTFIVMDTDQRNIKNGPSRAIFTNSIKSINKEVCKSFMINKVLPDISENGWATTVTFL